jgi:hypothetical protein
MPLNPQDNDKFESLQIRLNELFDKQEQGALQGDEICEQQKLLDQWEVLLNMQHS